MTDTAEKDEGRFRMADAVLIPGTPIFGCPSCFDPWESEPSCQHYDWTEQDPYAKPVGVLEGTRWHMHAEPICADPDCITYLTRSEMTALHDARHTRVIPSAVGDDR